MSELFTDVARAALPVGVALLLFAAVARGVLWAQLDDARAQRLARQYLEPLSTWALIALGVDLFASAASGDAGLTALALPVVLGVAAVLLRPVGSAPAAPAAPPAPATTAPAPPASAPAPAAPAPAPSPSLWTDETQTRQGALWSR